MSAKMVKNHHTPKIVGDITCKSVIKGKVVKNVVVKQFFYNDGGLNNFVILPNYYTDKLYEEYEFYRIAHLFYTKDIDSSFSYHEKENIQLLVLRTLGV